MIEAAAWDDVEAQTPIPGFTGKVLHSDSMSFVLWEIAEGATLPRHSHVHEQVAYILDGEFEMTVDGRTLRLRRGMVGSVPSNAPHWGRAITACRILDVFNPVREDYRGGLTSGVISGRSG